MLKKPIDDADDDQELEDKQSLCKYLLLSAIVFSFNHMTIADYHIKLARGDRAFILKLHGLQ